MNLRNLSKRIDYGRILEEQKAEAEYIAAKDEALAEFKREAALAQQEYSVTETQAKQRLRTSEIDIDMFGLLMSLARMKYATVTQPARDKLDAAEAEALRVFREKMAVIQEKYSFLEFIMMITGGANESTPVKRIERSDKRHA